MSAFFPNEEVQGFDTPITYREFAQLVERCVVAGTAKEVAVDQFYGHGKAVGGRWFRDDATGRTWRLIAPSEPFPGLWEQVYVA